MLQDVVDGMKEHQWGRGLSTRTIRSIIASGRCNAARQRNKELAAAGTPAQHGRPRKTRVPQAEAMLARKREFPQAMPEEEAEQMLGSTRGRDIRYATLQILKTTVTEAVRESANWRQSSN